MATGVFSSVGAYATTTRQTRAKTDSTEVRTVGLVLRLIETLIKPI